MARPVHSRRRRGPWRRSRTTRQHMSGAPDFARIGNELSRGLVAAGAFGGSVALVLGEHCAIFTHGEAQAGLAITPATPFHICSCSKIFTAAVFSRLVRSAEHPSALQTLMRHYYAV